MPENNKILAEPTQEDVELLLWGLENKEIIRKQDRTLALLLDMFEKKMNDPQMCL